MSLLLPEGFPTLEPFAETWAIAGSAARAERRGSATPAQLQAFYAAASEALPRALAHLDAKPLATLDAPDRRLMDMMLSLAHVSLSVEILGDDDTSHAAQRRHMRITRTPADQAPRA